MANANADLLRNYNKTQFFGEGKAASDVRVVGFANDALYGITAAINEQRQQVSDLSNSLDDANRTIEELRKGLGITAEQQRKDEKAKEQRGAVASQAAERNTRARNLALTGEIKKATSAIDVLKNTLKDAIDKMTSMLKESIKSSLRNFDDFSKTMRAANISHADKVAAQAAATAAKTVSGGVAVSMSSIHSAMTDLSSVNKAEFDRLAKSKDEADKLRLNTLGLLKERTSLSAEEIDKLSASFGKGQEEEFQKLALMMSSANGGEGVQKYVKGMVGTKEGQVALSKGDAIKILLEAAEGTQKLAYYGFNEAAAKFSETAAKIKEGVIEGVDQDVLQQMIAITGGNGTDPVKMATAIEDRLKGIAGIKDEEERKKAGEEFINMLRPLEDKGVGGITDMIKLVEKAKNGTFNEFTGSDIEQEKENVLDNAKDGKLKHYTEKAMAGINNITGNLLGRLSVNMDELFGGDLSMEDIVSKGFVTIVNLLRSIRLSMISTGLKNIVGFFKEKFSKSKEKEKKSDAKLVSDPIIDSSEKNTKSIVKEIKKLGTQLSGKSKLGKASGDASSSGDSKSKKKTVSSKALLGVGLGLGGIGAAAGVAGLLGSMGVFDSLKPIFGDFSKSVVPTIKTAVDTLAPTIDGILKQVAPVINDLLKSFGPVLKDVLDSLMPLAKDLMGFLINILNPLLPVVKNIIKSVVPILKDVFAILAPVLTDVVEVVSSVLQPLAALLKPIFNALKPVLKPLIEVLTKYNPFIIALQVVAKGVTAIAKKFGYDIEKEQREEEEKARREQSEKTRRETLAGYSNDELIKILETLALTKGNEGIANNLDFLTTQSKSDLIDTITSASTGYAGAADILDDDFNKLLQASKSGTAESNELLKQINDNLTGKKKSDEEARKKEEAQRKKDDQTLDAIKGVITGSAFGIPGAAIGGVAGYFKDQVVGGLINWLSPKARANGGVVDKPTTALVGEAGKEVIFPLTKPEKIREVLKLLSRDERFNLLKILLKYNTGITTEMISDAIQKSLIQKSALNNLPTSTVPGDDPDTINKILNMAGPYRDEVWRRLKYGWQGKTKDGFKQRKKWYDEALANAANQEGRELIKGTYAERALEYGVSELGKPYILRSLGKIGYVCNELVNACIQASGFNMGKFRVHGVKATFANIKKGKYSGEEYPNFRIRDDLTPQTAIPGMVFFQDARKNQEGGFQPGHIGLVYYGRQKLHAAGGSADYTKEGFLPNWQTPCRGVTVTPFDGSNYVIGEFPGLFEQATGEFKLPNSSPVKFGPSEISDNLGKHESEIKAESTVKSVGLLSTSDIQEIMQDAGINGKADAAQYVEQANKLLRSTASKEDIMTILYEIARYLKGIYSSPANKQHIVPVARPNEYTYGGSGSAR